MPRPDKIEAMLTKADPQLGQLIKHVVARNGTRRIETSPLSPFEALIRAIVFQSVSTKAATTIHKRVAALVKGKVVPDKVLAIPQETLKAAGLSRLKAKYIHNVAEWFNANRNLAKALPTLPDEEIIAALTGIQGIGLWTVNMLLMFNLGRADIMPATDLGIRYGVQLVYGLRKIAAPGFVARKARRWAPHRSIVALYLWSGIDLKLRAEDLKLAPKKKR